MSGQSASKKDDPQKTRYHGLGLSNQGRGVIKSQSIAFQNSKWSNVNSKSKEIGGYSSVVPEMTTVYVGRIPPQVTNAHIRKLLGVCGTILRWSRQEDPITRRLSSFGLCEFDSPEGVINAVNVLNGVKISGESLLVRYQHGIDKEMAKWQSSRINEMLKHRGGDCTIETILNELSASDSKMRVSVQRLLTGMSFEFGSEQEVSSPRESEDKGSSFECLERLGKKGSCSGSEVSSAHYHSQKGGAQLLVGLPQHPKEKLRQKRFQENSKGFERKLMELNEELYELVKFFPDSMDISCDLTSRYLLEVLHESYHNFKFISSSNRKTYDLVSQVIQSDKDFIASMAEDAHLSFDSDISEDKPGMETVTGPAGHLSTSSTHESRRLRDGMQKAFSDGARRTAVQDGGEQASDVKGADARGVSRISISLPQQSKRQSFGNPIESLESMRDGSKEDGGHSSFMDSSLGQAGSDGLVASGEVFSAENWRNILDSTEFEDYREYVEQEMRRIIGDSDQHALSTITNFIVEKFSSKTLIQETINVLIQILDTEAESFLHGLFLKIIDG